MNLVLLPLLQLGLLLLCVCDSGTSRRIQLTKKKISENVLFSRTQKYTNRTQERLGSQLTSELSLDILLIGDFSTYQAFLEISKADEVSAKHYVNVYLQAIFDQMKIIYDGIDFFGERLKLSHAGNFIAFREEDCPLWTKFEEIEELLNITETSNDTFAENATSSLFEHTSKWTETKLDELENDDNSTIMTLSMDSKEAIDRVTKWVRQYSVYLPKHDHAIVITKFDLLSPNGHSSTQGMAYVGNICQIGDSSSIVEDIGASTTALIAAHELGHSLGAVHDGALEAKECDTNENFLMAATVSGSDRRQSFLNSRQMSNCSIDSILKNLNKPSSSCVRKWRPISNHNNNTKAQDFSKKPGETLSVHQQCQIAFSPEHRACRIKGYYHEKNVCQRIWCQDRNAKRSDPCMTLNYFPAFEGTECDENMWCNNGLCVQNPKKWIDCTDVNAKTCSRYSKTKLKHFCKSKEFKNICCRTCSRFKT